MAKDQFCSNCGAELKETVKFCPACGKQISTDLEENDSKAQVNQIESDVLALDNNTESDSRKSFSQNSSQPTESFKTKYFSFKGRLNRKRYLFRSLKVGVFNMFFQLLLVGGGSNANTISGVILPIVLGIIVTIPIIISVISLGVRRFHDLNKSGYYYFFMFIPLINIIFGLYLLFAKGTDGENKYGIDPLMRI